MFQKIIQIYKNMDIKIHKILKYGLHFCFCLCIASILILLTYEALFAMPLLYHIGIAVFRLSLIFAIEFFICAFVIDAIGKQLV